MKLIMILGGTGQTGRLIAKHLMENTDVRLVLAGRNHENCQRSADQLNLAHPGERVSSCYADASKKESLLAVLPGVDLMIVAAPTTQYVEIVAGAALECGCDYLDVQLSESKLAVLKALEGEINQRNLCFITEAGYHPGLPSVLVRLAGTKFDSMQRAVTAGYLTMGSGAQGSRTVPYTEAVDELVDVFRNYRGQVFKEGSWTKTNSYKSKKIDFSTESGEPGIGVRTCYSMFFDELKDLPALYPELKEMGFYMAGTHWLLDYVISPLAVALLKYSPESWNRPIGKLIWWGMCELPRPPYLVLLKVEAGGVKDGLPSVFEASISHKDGYELTAIPVAACVMQYLEGFGRKTGLWMMGHLVNPEKMLADMQQMGVRVRMT